MTVAAITLRCLLFIPPLPLPPSPPTVSMDCICDKFHRSLSTADRYLERRREALGGLEALEDLAAQREAERTGFSVADPGDYSRFVVNDVTCVV